MGIMQGRFPGIFQILWSVVFYEEKKKMIQPEKFVEVLEENGIGFYTGVPDSFLHSFCSYLQQTKGEKENIIAANEGNAVAIAAGYYLSEQKVPLVYMQNSGIGNAINPLVSLVDKSVYGIPMVLLVGWRGEPGIGDHEQHMVQGKTTKAMFETVGIPVAVLEDNEETMTEVTASVVEKAVREKRAVALIVKKGVFTGVKKKITDTSYPMSREDAIRIILETLPKDTIYTATTGRATRELYIVREERGESHECDFLNVGSMGHASSVALGIALSHADRKVVCLDGDGAAIMHMGAFAIIGEKPVPNLLHIVLNNGAHESVGGQPSAGRSVDFAKVAEGCGYEKAVRVATSEELKRALTEMRADRQALFIEVRIRAGMRDTLGPLKASLKEDIKKLMEELKERK